MNLYKIIFTHSGPKDTKEGIEGFVLGENDNQVYDYIDKKYNYSCWKDKEEQQFELYDDNLNVIGTESFKERIIRLKGEMDDDNYDYGDAYYGITLYGWELVKQNITGDLSQMIELGVVKTIS